jgi:hypothetical protein
VKLLTETVDGWFGLLQEADAFTEIVKRAANGDAGAVGEVYSRYTKKFVSMLKGRGLSVEDADDVVQNFFAEKVLGGNWLGKFAEKNPDASGQAYVRGMTRAVLNLAGDLRRKNKVRHASALTGAEKTKHSRAVDLRKVIAGAMDRVLKKYRPHEKAFLKALLTDKDGSFHSPKHGALQTIAKKHAPKGSKDPVNWGSALKRRFTKQFCTDKDLCGVLRTHQGQTVRATATKYACKGVPGACVEEIAVLAHGVTESETLLSEDVAIEMVLGWIRGQLASE